MKTIAISINEGRAVRDLFNNDFLDLMMDRDIKVLIFSEAANVPKFVNSWKKQNIEFFFLPPANFNRIRYYAYKIRRLLMQFNSRFLVNIFHSLETRYLYPAPKEYLELLKKYEVDLVITSNVLLQNDMELISAASISRVPTLGIVQSWDNVHKGLKCRTDKLTVWNEINQVEVANTDLYLQDDVVITGPVQFDQYYASDTLWSRNQFAERLDIDPYRPIVLFASLGYFIPGFDETCWMEILLEDISMGSISGSPQVICRLHPWSKSEHFLQFAGHPDVRLSYVDKYIPGLTWYMTREDVILVANMLHHANLVITPGSTMVLEAAIFNTPTIVPTFHPYQPDRANDYFKNVVFDKHFKRIMDLDLAPIVNERESFPAVVERCLNNQDWYQSQRTRLVEDYVHFTDGNSVHRFVNQIEKMLMSRRE